MKEQLVSLGVAKLAKEKGFKPEREWNPEYVSGYLDYELVMDEPEKGTVLTEFQEEDYSCDGYYLAPSQTILQKWLREKHFIIVEPRYNLTFNYWNLLIYTPLQETKVWYFPKEAVYSTYEQALEDGLMEALLIL